MPLVKVGSKHQVVIPKAVFAELGLAPGDYVEIAVLEKRAVLTRKKMVDDFPLTDEAVGPKTRAAIVQAVKETKAGKGHGPFENSEELIADLHRRVRLAK